MKRIFAFCVCAVMVTLSIVAQDVIITMDAQKIDAKILEVSKTEVKYKEKNNLNGPTFVLETKEISSVIYANGKVVLYNQEDDSISKKEIHEQVQEETHEANYNCEIHLLSGNVIKGRIMERANNYVAYSVDGKYYTIPASQVEYVKDLQTGEVTKYLGAALDGKPVGSLIISNSNKQQDNSTPKYVSRNGNTYYYAGKAMNENSYSKFLQDNCPNAYDMFHKGDNIATAGWLLFAVGVGCDLGTLINYAIVGGNSAITAFSVIGLGCEIACIPTLIVGYNKKHKSADVFNTSCAIKSSQAYWSVNASQYGIGIAYNF